MVVTDTQKYDFEFGQIAGNGKNLLFKDADGSTTVVLAPSTIKATMREDFAESVAAMRRQLSETN